jgi:hypothetical protein
MQLSFAASAQPTGSLSVSEAKAGIKAKLAACFCDRDKAVVLGDVEYAWFASVDREQGRMAAASTCRGAGRVGSSRPVPGPYI